MNTIISPMLLQTKKTNTPNMQQHQLKIKNKSLVIITRNLTVVNIQKKTLIIQTSHISIPALKKSAVSMMMNGQNTNTSKVSNSSKIEQILRKFICLTLEMLGNLNNSKNLKKMR